MILLVRHGEAAATWAEARDPGLSPLGTAQAETTAQKLSRFSLSRVICSPMQRCRETSAPFAKLSGLSPVIEPHVSEIPTPDGLEDRAAWLRGFMEGSWADAPGLLTGWRDALLAKLGTLEDETVVFTHFIAINTIVGALDGREDVISFRPGHCSITKLERAGSGWRVAERGSEAATEVL